MKKKFIYFLCNIKLFWLAYKISPSIAGKWRIAQSFKRLQDQTKELAAAFEKLNVEFQIYIKSNEVIKMKIKLDNGAKMPTRAHETDAGLDLYARETQIVPAKESAIFDTGVHVELPVGTVGMLKSKSGLNVKHGLTSEGVIDVGYTGSIVVKLYNNSGYDYRVEAGDKISQLVIMPILTPPLELVESLDATERGAGGFGSTGK